MELRPGNHDRAWNDPPVFAYQPGSAGQPPSDISGSTNKRTLLNKRVAFPLMGTAATASSNTPGTSVGPPPALPPLPSGTPLLPPLSTVAPPLLPPLSTGTPLTFFTPNIPSTIEQMGNNDEKIDEAKQDMDEELEVTIELVKNTINNTLETLQSKNKQEELKRRLQSLYTSWEEGKLNFEIKKRMIKLCQHMDAKDFTAADHIQVSLAVDYTSECTPWILAIKNLLHVKNTES